MFHFLATLVALHFTPVSESVSGSAEFRTSVASRLASLFQYIILYDYDGDDGSDDDFGNIEDIDILCIGQY